RRYRAASTLPSFPTRRSSDLETAALPLPGGRGTRSCRGLQPGRSDRRLQWVDGSSRGREDGESTPQVPGEIQALLPRPLPRLLRSEEHTSELQSRVDLVCRLL